MTNNRKRIFVTGATGFVGSHIVNRLLADNHDVHVLVRKDSNLWRIKNITDKITLHEGELTEKDSLKLIIDKINPEGVFHLGASTIMSGISASADKMIKTNLLGTINLIDVLSDTSYEFFVNTGSFIEYRGENRPVSESDICEPKEVYGITKLGATLYASAIGKIKNKPIITLRVFTPYGPFIQKGKLIEQIIVNTLEGKMLKLTKPTIARDFIFIDDLVDLFIEAAGTAGSFKGEIFNAGSGVKTTIKELSDYIRNIIKSDNNILWDEKAAVVYDLDSWQADTTKTFASFSWRPKNTLLEGVNKTIDFYRSLGVNL